MKNNPYGRYTLYEGKVFVSAQLTLIQKAFAVQQGNIGRFEKKLYDSFDKTLALHLHFFLRFQGHL
jgi:hypothetical protein